jgi:ABC-type nitrate/sulfonate/bicarbonate transport system permease component
MDHSMHQGRPTGAALTRLAISATLHCLTGCAIGEVLGMVVGTALGWSDAQPSCSPSRWRSCSATHSPSAR